MCRLFCIAKGMPPRRGGGVEALFWPFVLQKKSRHGGTGSPTLKQSIVIIISLKLMPMRLLQGFAQITNLHIGNNQKQKTPLFAEQGLFIESSKIISSLRNVCGIYLPVLQYLPACVYLYRKGAKCLKSLI